MGEFVRDLSDSRRVVIIDVSHLFYKYAFGGAQRLSASVMVDGRPVVVDTTLSAYTTKTIHRWSNKGVNPVVVCFDGAGSNRCRKAYFRSYSQNVDGGQAVGYKESRNFNDQTFFQGVEVTLRLLRNGGVVALRAENYEADDLIKAAVDKAKETYPHLPIDIITGDQDLLPLVDDQVSVFIASRRMTWAEDKSLEKKNYVQITPANYQSYIETLSEFRNLHVPYNTVLLKKLLRGKKADDVPGYPKFTPTKFNNLVYKLEEDGHDLGALFRYGVPIKQVVYRGTQEVIPADMVDTVPVEQKMLKFLDPPELTMMLDVLSEYLDEDTINHIRYVYNGVNLNAAFTDNLPDQFKRKPAVITIPIEGYVASVLQQAVSEVRINLPIV